MGKGGFLGGHTVLNIQKEIYKYEKRNPPRQKLEVRKKSPEGKFLNRLAWAVVFNEPIPKIPGHLLKKVQASGGALDWAAGFPLFIDLKKEYRTQKKLASQTPEQRKTDLENLSIQLKSLLEVLSNAVEDQKLDKYQIRKAKKLLKLKSQELIEVERKIASKVWEKQVELPRKP